MNNSHRWVAILLRRNSIVYLLLNALTFIIGLLLVQIGGTVEVDIGSSLSAAGVAGWVVFLLVLLQEDERARQKNLNKLGFRNIFTQRSIAIRPEYEARLNDAHGSIDILGFGLKAFREDFASSFEAWCTRCVIRVLLIDPGSTYAAARDNEETQGSGVIKSDVEAFLAATQDLRERLPSKFMIRLYSALPSINLLRIDNEMFFGPYLVGEPSRSTPTVLISNGPIFDKMMAHFERLWSDEFSRPA